MRARERGGVSKTKRAHVRGCIPGPSIPAVKKESGAMISITATESHATMIERAGTMTKLERERLGPHSRGQDEPPCGNEGEEYDRSRVNEVETTNGTHQGDREGETMILCGFEADLLLACEARSGTVVKVCM